MHEQRAGWRAAIEDTEFDVAVIGGGINGAGVFAELSRRGYRVLLADRGDFGGGSSQSSAMWVWGGLLYLATMDFSTVLRLCAARDRLIRGLPDWVRPTLNRYVCTREDARGPLFVKLALWLYWSMGAFRRRRPVTQREFPERHALRPDRVINSLLYEEGAIFPSDARFVAHWIQAWRGPERPALNYCDVVGGRYDRNAARWHVEMRDRVSGAEFHARARWVVNAAGVWTDAVNERFGIRSEWRHVFGKGVFLVLPRDTWHVTPLTFENRLRDCYSLVPWGPVALWGPTETVAPDPDEGFVPHAGDVRALLDELNRHVLRRAGPADVIALRCGVRPLAVRRGYDSDRYTLAISRRHVVARDARLPWISLYGGKLSSCVSIGESVVGQIGAALMPGRSPEPNLRSALSDALTEPFPGLAERVVSAAHAMQSEDCLTLEDYLRRRTNIAQWVPRHGLGRDGEHLARFGELAALFPGVDGVRGPRALAAYAERVDREFDRVLAAV